MKKITTCATILTLSLSGAAFALSDAAAQIDANADGVLTIDELQAAYPDVTLEMFTAMDLNADGTLDTREVTAAEEAGMMPSSHSGG